MPTANLLKTIGDTQIFIEDMHAHIAVTHAFIDDMRVRIGDTEIGGGDMREVIELPRMLVNETAIKIIPELWG